MSREAWAAVSVIEELAEACGPEHVWEAGPADRVDGVPASWVVAPGTAEEVSGVLRAAAAAGLSIRAVRCRHQARLGGSRPHTSTS